MGVLAEWSVVGDVVAIMVVVPLVLKVSGLKLRKRWELQLSGIEWGNARGSVEK